MPSWPSAIPRAPRTFAAPWLRRPSLAAVVSVLVVSALLLGGWTWLRGSSLVAVTNVTVSGATGLGAPAVRSALTGSAQQMTTLNFDRGVLTDSIARFPLVRGISISTKFPHGMSITVHQRQPVASLVGPGGAVAVADDGVILNGIPTTGLPIVEVTKLERGPRVVDPVTAAEVELMALTPKRLLGEITQVTSGAEGLVVTLRAGPTLRFGDVKRLKAKWVAANRVLQDPQAAGAGYIDVSIPERPASGLLTTTDSAPIMAQ